MTLCKDESYIILLCIQLKFKCLFIHYVPKYLTHHVPKSGAVLKTIISVDKQLTIMEENQKVPSNPCAVTEVSIFFVTSLKCHIIYPIKCNFFH